MCGSVLADATHRGLSLCGQHGWQKGAGHGQGDRPGCGSRDGADNSRRDKAGHSSRRDHGQRLLDDHLRLGAPVLQGSCGQRDRLGLSPPGEPSTKL